MRPDFGLAASDYGRHRPGFPPSPALVRSAAAAFPGETLAVLHRVFAVVGRAPA